MDFHRLAEQYPLMPSKDLNDLEADMRLTGYDHRFPIVTFQGAILDGRNRFIAADRAEVKPVYVAFTGTEAEADLFVQRANEHRRHLTTEWLAAKRLERIERVSKARSEGKSTRQIAEEEGVSETQTRRDLAESAPYGAVGSPSDGKTTGKDGKIRPATRPVIRCARCSRLWPNTDQATPNCQQCAFMRSQAKKPPEEPPEPDEPPPVKPDDICDRCWKEGKVKGCPMCKELREPSPPKPPKPEPDVIPVDAFGTPLPKRCQKAYLDPWMQESIDFLAQIEEKLRLQRLVESALKRKSHYPFVNTQDVADGIGFAMQYLDQVLEHLKQFRPAGVCPRCSGEGCTNCLMCGMVPRETYEHLKKTS